MVLPFTTLFFDFDATKMPWERAFTILLLAMVLLLLPLSR